MKKSKKSYKKAMELYSNGYIDKALDKCSKSIRENKDNSAALNLKGLLYYFKGDLKSAEDLWKVNYKYNKDEVSKKYLQDIDNDKEMFHLYVKGVNLYNSIKVNEALEIFKRCSYTDYNNININNYLCGCYIKKGEYEEAKKYLNKVFNIDKKNYIAKEYKKQLIDCGVLKKKNIKLKVLTTLASLAIIFFAVNWIPKMTKLVKIKSTKNINYNKKEKLPDKKVLNIKKDSQNIDNKHKNNSKDFSIIKMNKYIKDKDIDNTYAYLSEFEYEKLPINEQNIYNKGKTFFIKEGIEYYYDKGINYLRKEEFENAEKNFNKAFHFSKNHYLRSHIIYLFGISYEEEGKIDKCIEKYSLYNKEYPNRQYEKEVLYKLAILNTDEKSRKQYAKELVEKYPKSIYNNNKIDEIIRK